MSNGTDMPDKSNKMAAIHEKINYLMDSCKKNLSLSSEIRAKLLCSDLSTKEESEKTPREGGQLNNIRDSLQDLLDLANAAKSHLIAVNKEV